MANEQRKSETLYNPESILDRNGDRVVQRFDIEDALADVLGDGWQIRATQLVDDQGVLSILQATDPTNREEDPTQEFAMVTLTGDLLLAEFPEMEGLYHGLLADLMRLSMEENMEPFKTYEDPRFGLEVYAQVPPPEGAQAVYRLDAHVDGRYTAILPLDVPKAPSGGRLVVANNPDALTVAEIDLDATYISHRIGSFVCAPRLTTLPHYTEPLQAGDSRAIVSINFPKESEPTGDAQRLHAHFSGM